MLPSFGETFDCIAIDVRIILKFKKSVSISNIFKRLPFGSAYFQGIVHYINDKLNIQYLRSNKVNLEWS